MKIWIVFCNDTDIWFLKALKPGFRHCFALIRDEAGWLTYDPMAHCTDLMRHSYVDDAINLPDFFTKQGMKIIAANRQYEALRRILPLRPYTCVEAMKRLIGLRAPYVFTPYQLYNHLGDLNHGITQPQTQKHTKTTTYSHYP